MNWGCTGSAKALDVNLMKLSKRIGYVTKEEGEGERHSLYAGIGSNSGIRCPSLGANLGNINVRGDRLKESL